MNNPIPTARSKPIKLITPRMALLFLNNASSQCHGTIKERVESDLMDPARSTDRNIAPMEPWLNRTTFGVGITSLFSDWSHEIATAILPAFLATIGAGPAWLGLLEGIADG